ncbi:MAG: type VI secretion system tip protein VgrG [Deltaproteobacteria bacterium]|jgi:type VI secretion system secreted protein VgrG|nr:type VI secretion system tip protein VgrG [Deltaproteobacteria bacterium]
MPSSWEFSGTSAAGKPLSGFRVLAFAGLDEICRGYALELLLLAGNIPADKAEDAQNDLLGASRLKLTGRRSNGDSFAWQGMAGEVSRLFSAGGNPVLRVLLRPSSCKLSLSSHSRIFLNMALPQALDRLLQEEGLTAGLDFSNKLGQSYKMRPLTCQYNETAAALLARHLERTGGYSYIKQTEAGDALVLADGQTAVEALPVKDALDWNEQAADEVVFAFARTAASGPTRAALRDYISDQPNALTSGQASDALHSRGGGEVNMYGLFNLFGESILDGKAFSAEVAGSQAEKLAAARMRDFVSRANRAQGAGTIPWLRAGYSFSLNGESFQLLSVRHACNLAGDEEDEKLLRRAADLGFAAGGAPRGYRNSFVCHPLAVGAFAPECLTPWPAVAGLVSARIDAAGGGEYAEVDNNGRYKVKFFFPEKVIAADAEVSQDGNWSIPLGMMQPHAGSSSGIHFPLLKGVEVLVAFTHGDPDRPVILGAMPNPEHPSVVVDQNQQTNVIRTPGGNSITMTDTEGQKEIRLESADQQTRISIF